MFLKGRNYCDYFVASEIGGGLFLLSVKLPVVAAAAALVVCLCVVVFFSFFPNTPQCQAAFEEGAYSPRRGEGATRPSN